MAVARERVHFDRYSLIVASPGFQTLRAYSIKEDSVNRIEVVVVARQTDGLHRCLFKRVGLFYRLGSGAVLIQGMTWQTSETFKSDSNMEIKYVLGADTVTFQVRNAALGTTSTRWSGYTDKIEVR